MKKTILSGLIVAFMLVMAMSVIAPPVPAPVSGKVTINGKPVGGYNVQVTNLDTAELLTYNEILSLKTEKGMFMFDLSDFSEGYFERDRRGAGSMIKIVACPHVDCVYTFEVIDTMPKKLIFEITDEDIVTYQCWDNSYVIDKALCPRKPTPPDPIVMYECWDGSMVNDMSLCPEKDEEKDIWDYLFSLALVILGALGLAGFVKGLSLYYWNKGKSMIEEGKLTDNEELIEKGKAYKKRALKMLITGIKRAKEGKYDKK